MVVSVVVAVVVVGVVDVGVVVGVVVVVDVGVVVSHWNLSLKKSSMAELSRADVPEHSVVGGFVKVKNWHSPAGVNKLLP